MRDAGPSDLHVVPGVAVKISTAWRTGLIPDLVVLNTKPTDVAFQPDEVVLAVEIWSPQAVLETKMAAHASADVRHFWAVDPNGTVTTYRLADGGYIEEMVARPGSTMTLAAPVPVTFDPAELRP